MKLLILGDVHGYWEDLNIVMARAIRLHPDITHFVQVGDFGYAWPGAKPFKFYKQYWEDADLKKAKSIPFHWLDGNHENFAQLEIDQGASQPDMIYQPRGSTKRFECGVEEAGPGIPHGFVHFKTAMFFGGASSIDKDMRIQDKSWWPQESITYKQTIDAMNQETDAVDIMFSHEFPIAFPYGSYKEDFGRSDKQALEALRVRFKPKFWVFGHHHKYGSGETQGCKWACAPIIESRQALLWDGDDLRLILPAKDRSKTHFDTSL